MQILASELASWLEGTLEGDGNIELSRTARIDHPEEGGPGTVSFVSNPKYQKYLADTTVSVVIVSESLEVSTKTTLIRVADPYSAITKVLQRFESARYSRDRKGVDAGAHVHASAEVHPEAWIGAGAIIDQGASVSEGAQIFPGAYVGENAKVGAHSVIHPGVCLYDSCEIGAHCTVHAGSAIGSDGFGFAPQPDGSFQKIPQTGNVVLEDHVEVGANSAIDRATIGSTVIRAGAKVDNLVQIAHNVEIGSFTVLAAQSGVSGSTVLGKGVMVGGQAGFVGHLEIADGTRVNAQSGVNRSVSTPGTAVTGSPAGKYVDELRNQVVYRRLPELEKRLVALEKEISRLKESQ